MVSTKTRIPLVSVIIPACNAENTISQAIKAVKAQDYPSDSFEVIVVDDGSSDATALIAEAEGVKVIKQSNQGAAAARNRGAKVAKGKLILFTDADCEPVPNWIATMVTRFEDAKVAAVKGAYLTRQTKLTPRFVQLEYEDKYQRMRRFETIDFIDTYSAGFRHDVFINEGGYDTSFPSASVEDQEFSFRLAKKGYRMVFEPGAIVFHRHAQSLSDYFKKKFKIGYWKVFLLLKHPEKVVADSHTPQTLKIQMLIACIIIATAIILAAFGVGLWLILASMLIYLVLDLPLVSASVKKDPLPALLAPVYTFVRSVALGAGMLKGLLDFVILKKR